MTNNIKSEQYIETSSSNGISCELCQNVISDPVTLPCLDTFCLACLQSYQFNPTPACPSCQTTFFILPGGLSALRYNKFTTKVITHLRILNINDDDKFCEICDPNHSANQMDSSYVNLAKRYCLECNQKFCFNCLAYHQRMKATSSHNVVELGIKSSEHVEQRPDESRWAWAASAEPEYTDAGACPFHHTEWRLSFFYSLALDEISLPSTLLPQCIERQFPR